MERPSKEQIEVITMEQGRLIQELLNHPAWPIVENVIRITKLNNEIDRSNRLVNDPNGSKALYFSGRVDGAEEVRKNIYKVVQDSINLKESIRLQKEIEEGINA